MSDANHAALIALSEIETGDGSLGGVRNGASAGDRSGVSVSSGADVNGDRFDAVEGAASNVGQNTEIAPDGDDRVTLPGLNTGDLSAGDFLLV